MTTDQKEDSETEILQRPKSLTPNEDVPPHRCASCGTSSFSWDGERECWDCDRCPSATHLPDPSKFYKCPECKHPFPEWHMRCKKCGSDWSELVEAQT